MILGNEWPRRLLPSFVRGLTYLGNREFFNILEAKLSEVCLARNHVFNCLLQR
jgi:hypothetical protein